MKQFFIENARIRLSQPTLDDHRRIYESWMTSDVIHAYNFELALSFDAFVAFCKRQVWDAAIYAKDPDALIGRIGIAANNGCPDLSLTIFSEYRGKNYGTEACRLGIRYAQDHLSIPVLYAGCYQDNIASYHMLKKCGFQRHPAGDAVEPHVLAGEDRLQYDFIINIEKE